MYWHLKTPKRYLVAKPKVIALQCYSYLVAMVMDYYFTHRRLQITDITKTTLWSLRKDILGDFVQMSIENAFGVV